MSQQQDNNSQPKRVLIVDDEPNVVVSLEFLMQEAGYAVDVATTGEDAIEMIPEVDPDLILLDIMLPGISGFEICRWVRESSEWDGVKIVMLTAKGRDVAKGFALGADAYITKPFSTRDLMAEVQDVLEAT